VPKETFENECRVALTPAGVASLRKAGFKGVIVESGAGAAANFSDAQYEAAGATIGSAKDAFGQDIVLKVRPPSAATEVDMFRPGSSLVSFLYPAQNKELVEKLQAKQMTVLGELQAGDVRMKKLKEFVLLPPKYSGYNVLLSLLFCCHVL